MGWEREGIRNVPMFSSFHNHNTRLLSPVDSIGAVFKWPFHPVNKTNGCNDIVQVGKVNAVEYCAKILSNCIVDKSSNISLLVF